MQARQQAEMYVRLQLAQFTPDECLPSGWLRHCAQQASVAEAGRPLTTLPDEFSCWLLTWLTEKIFCKL